MQTDSIFAPYLQDKIVLAHKGYYNAACEEIYRENSLEACRSSGTKDYISIIELDLRKSKDGILYCYHGSLLEYYTELAFPKDFSFIQKKYGAESLKDILDGIPRNKIIFLDIKERTISREDILGAFAGKKFREVILGNKSVSFLNRYERMPEEFVKILNGNIFCRFYDLKKLKESNFKYFEVVFPWQISKRLIQKVEKAGMEFRCATLFFRSKKSYWRTIEKYHMKHVSSDCI